MPYSSRCIQYNPNDWPILSGFTFAIRMNHISMKLCQTALFAFVILAAVFSFIDAASADSSFTAIKVDAATGSYTVAAGQPAWSFTGTVGIAVTDLKITYGKDAVGSYVRYSFEWTDVHPFAASIRYYPARSSFLFSITSKDALNGPTPDFPVFTSFPANLHKLSFTDYRFSPAVFSLEKTSTPWFLFDNDGTLAALSPASDFIVAQQHGDGVSSIASGLQPSVAAVPAGFTHKAVLTVGQGIESTIYKWGHVLTALSGKHAPNDNADLMLKYLGFWTDNGAYYYYNYDFSKGYANTLLGLDDEYLKKDNIPLHYLQLDSWWYMKSRTAPDGQLGGPKNASLPEGTWNAYGGTLDYSASPALFPQGLKAFDEKLGMPLVVHGRWIDPASPYHAQYKISGIAPIDPRYWKDRAKYLKENGVICYEQDWLSEIYPNSPEMATDIAVGDEFTDNMARATKADHETLQYCMATPRFFLQGSKYDNLTTIRTGDDLFIRSRWNDFIYTSAFANALNMRPWADVLFSTDTGSIVLAALSSGPVGVGDKIGAESVSNIMKVIRGDGAIIKPDVPLLPTDASILNDAADAHLPLISSTYTNNGQKTVYVFAFTRKGDSLFVSFLPASLGLSGPIYITSTYGISKKQDASDIFTDTLGATGWNYYQIAPVGRSGITFFGDANKFMGNGRIRIKSISDTPTRLTAVVNYDAARDSVVTLHGYSAVQPSVKAINGHLGAVSYNTSTKEFTVDVSAPPAPKPAAGTADPITQIKVELTVK
jgi:hypothetical protein